MFKLEMTTDNAAFEFDAGAEISRILGKLAESIGHAGLSDTADGYLRDANGNKVGTWSFTPAESE